MSGIYGEHEMQYATPFANALVSSSAFREWIVQKTEFVNYAKNAFLLHDEMLKRRSKGTVLWWNSHFTGSCKCEGCAGGRETDLLAVFRSTNNFEFALHVEVKQPNDRLTADQAYRYGIRARCWTDNTPETVVPHQRADTMLLCSEKMRSTITHVSLFGSVVTFEECAENFQSLPFKV